MGARAVSDYHVTQYDGTTCGSRNCAAASGAMAVAFAGGDQMTAKQFRLESGISCSLGVDTVSGGLRIVDVMRVAQAHGVLLNYGGLQSWPATALRARLAIGQGAIVLGDCQEAPVSPSLNVVYHSAFVHGLDGSDRTHWHDPRLSAASWQPVSKVITYWEGMDHGMRYAGFVAANQIVTPPESDTDPIQEDPMAAIVIDQLGSLPAGTRIVVPDGMGIFRIGTDGQPIHRSIPGNYEALLSGVDRALYPTEQLYGIAFDGGLWYVKASEVDRIDPTTTGTLTTTTAPDGQSVTVTIKGG